MHTRIATDDLFERSTMSFGEHLEDLRRALMKAALCLVVGCDLALFAADWTVRTISRPFKAELKQFHWDRIARDYVQANQKEAPPQLLDWMAVRGVTPRRVFEVVASPPIVAQSIGSEMFNQQSWWQELSQPDWHFKYRS